MAVAVAPAARLLAHDRALGARHVAGADEAGRGCLAGPLVVAAVCLDTERDIDDALEGLDDSKRINPARREQVAAAVIGCACSVAVMVVPAAEIDRFGLHRSNLRALAQALAALGDLPDARLSDGFALGESAPPHRAIPGGDRTSAAIAAASVIAKVTRDRYMLSVAGAYPDYGFERHVGYITPEHSAAVRAHGTTPLHRLSFAAAAYMEAV
jgi:ribonuclease HII